MGGEVGDRRFGCSKSTSTISTSAISTQQFANSTKKGAKLFWIIESKIRYDKSLFLRFFIDF